MQEFPTKLFRLAVDHIWTREDEHTERSTGLCFQRWATT